MTNDVKLREFREQIREVLTAVRIYETRAPTPAELNAEAQNFMQDFPAMQRWIAFLRTDPPDQQQKAAAVQMINLLIVSLEQLAQHANARGHPLERVIFSFISELRQVENIGATGAGGAGTPAMRQVTQTLERLDAIVIQEAEQVAAEIRTELSEEAKKMQLAHAEWAYIQKIATELKQALDLLKNAERLTGLPGRNNLMSAETLLKATEGDINIAITYVKDAIQADVLEEGVASNAAKKLNDIYRKLISEANGIKSAKGWGP